MGAVKFQARSGHLMARPGQSMLHLEKYVCDYLNRCRSLCNTTLVLCLHFSRHLVLMLQVCLSIKLDFECSQVFVNFWKLLSTPVLSSFIQTWVFLIFVL